MLDFLIKNKEWIFSGIGIPIIVLISNLTIPIGESETEQIDLIISKAQKEISAIKEYRESLITDLVTGKRCLPNDLG